METIGERLKQIRQRLSQREMAERLGIPQQTWSNYENNRSNPDYLLIDKICTNFGVNVEWLLFGRGSVYDEDKVHLVHGRVGGGPDALRCGRPSSTIELKPEYKQALERNATAEAAVSVPPSVRCGELLDRLLAAHDRLDQVQEQAKALLKENGDLKAEIGELREELAVFKKVFAEKEMEEGIPRSA